MHQIQASDTYMYAT